MIDSINKFSSSYFSPMTNLFKGTEDKEPLKGLKIASYFTIVIPLVVALVWAGSTLAGRVKQILSDATDQVKKTNDLAMSVIAPNKINLTDNNLKDVIRVCNDIYKEANFDSYTDEMFDLKSTNDDKKKQIENNKIILARIKLKDIEFFNKENDQDKLIIKDQNNEKLQVIFSNRNPSNGELRGSRLKDLLTEQMNSNPNSDKNLFDAINDLVKKKNVSPLYTALKNYLIYDEKINGHIDELSDAIYALIEKGETVDVARARQIINENHYQFNKIESE